MSNMNPTPGTNVRSFDFDSRDVIGERACYVEGLLVSILPKGSSFAVGPDQVATFPDYDRYVIRVNRRVAGGHEVDVRSEWVFPPVNGIPKFFGGVTDGVRAV